MSELLTVEEVAKILRVSRRTVYREIAAGRIRTCRVRGRTFITSREVDAYIAARVRAA